MQDAASVRRAALGAIEDIEPCGLRDRIETQLHGSSMVPGVMTLRSAAAAGDRADDGDAPAALRRRAAGVQLIYDGLALTRQLAREEPWVDGDRDAADLSILAADVLVARGFYLLARTDAAGAAVDTVRSFGRDQTVRHETDDPDLDRNLEADVLDLALVAGATAVGRDPDGRLRDTVAGFADGADFADADQFFTPRVGESLRALSEGTPTAEGVPTSVDD